MMFRAAALMTVLLLAVPRPTPAEACGIKLTAKTPAPKRIARAAKTTGPERPVVAARSERTPIAAGPARVPAPRVVAARTAEPATRPAAPIDRTPTPAPEPAPTPPPAPKVAAVETKPPQEEPVAKPAPAVRPQAFAGSEVYFGVGNATMTPQAKKSIDKTASWLNATPDASIVIEGHADTSGAADANMQLSQTRAEAVRDYLVAAGIDASRLEVAALGSTKPKYAAGHDGRNRRVAIVKK